MPIKWGAEWILDSTGLTQCTTEDFNNALALDAGGTLHLVFQDERTLDLAYATGKANSWASVICRRCCTCC